ncbi:MAG: hypothetical protein QW212_05460 [Nitrososphaerales archaeon]
MLARYVVDHFERSGSSLQGELSFNQKLGEEVVEIMGNTMLGPFAVKIRDEPLTDKEIDDFYNLCVASRLYEGLVISPNKPMDKAMQTILLFDNKIMVKWFRVRNIEDAVTYITTYYTFEALFEGTNAYLICTPKLLPKKKA